MANQSHSHRISPPAAAGIDRRIDQIGFINEIVRQYIEGDGGIKAQLKAALERRGELRGEYFLARLDQAQGRGIEAIHILRLLARGRITQAQAADMFTVRMSVADEVLDAATRHRLTTITPLSPRLVIQRLPGVQVELVEAIRGLTRTLRPK